MSSRSIPVEKLRALLDAIKADHPEWDGFSQSLAGIFKALRIDPKIVYAKFYSDKKPFLVVSYTWRSTSLRQLADICDGTSAAGQNYFGRPLHLGKTTWIDVLFTCQFGLDATPESSVLIVALTAERYSAAYEHLVVLADSFFRRAWCLAELAVTASAPGIRILPVGDWAAQEAELAGIESFFGSMEATMPADVGLVQAFAVDRFGSPAAFDAAVRLDVAGRLRAAATYLQAGDHFYGDKVKGIAKDQVVGRKLYEEAAALGHADAQQMVGSCHSLGEGGLAKDLAEAARRYRLAADGGSVEGLSRLAMSYRYGDGGLPRDPAAAARLRSLAADQGDGCAMHKLGVALEEGADGVARDTARAARMFSRALRTAYADEGRAGLARLGAAPPAPAEAARLEAGRLARLDAARRGGRAAAQLVAVAVAGGPEWDGLAAEADAAEAAAARESDAE
jgi:TPR repeat protein